MGGTGRKWVTDWQYYSDCEDKDRCIFFQKPDVDGIGVTVLVIGRTVW